MTSEYTGQVLPRATPDSLEKAKRNPPVITFDDDRRRPRAFTTARPATTITGPGVRRPPQDAGRLRRYALRHHSDHGEEFDHGRRARSHRVPRADPRTAHLRLPGRVPAGQRDADRELMVDIGPTSFEGTASPRRRAQRGTRCSRICAARSRRCRPSPSVTCSTTSRDPRGRWKLVRA